METRSPADVFSRRVPVTVETGRAAPAEPPTASFRKGALCFSNVSEEARGAAVIVAVDGAEAVAVLVNTLIGSTDGVTFWVG